MNNTLLFHIESLATLKARSWALSRKEWARLEAIQKVILEKGQVVDQVDLWQKEIDKLRIRIMLKPYYRAWHHHLSRRLPRDFAALAEGGSGVD